MEQNNYETYRTANYHPKKFVNFGTIESVLHSICRVDNITWKEAFRRLIHCAAECGTMPQDRHSIRCLLKESGFFIQAGSYANRPVIDIIHECSGLFNDGEQVIVNLFDSPNHGIYMPIVPVRVGNEVHYELQYPKNFSDQKAREVWIRWKDHQDHSIAPRRKTGRIAKKKEMSAKDSGSLVAFNENPTDNLVGDCAVRALAGVLEISWEEAALKLAEAGDFVCPYINSTTNIEKCLENEGFEKFGPIRKDGRIISGKEFCGLIHDMFQAGTRIYAFPGKHHAVAILVFDNEYKIVDTWDSTGEPIMGYWAKYPERRQRPRKPEQISDLPKKLTELTVGTKLRHKIYGIGEVIEIDNSIAVIRFENDVEKKLAVDWVIVNCKAV